MPARLGLTQRHAMAGLGRSRASGFRPAADSALDQRDPPRKRLAHTLRGAVPVAYVGAQKAETGAVLRGESDIITEGGDQVETPALLGEQVWLETRHHLSHIAATTMVGHADMDATAAHLDADFDRGAGTAVAYGIARTFDQGKEHVLASADSDAALLQERIRSLSQRAKTICA